MNLLVIGDSCKDIYIYGKCEKMCPDAPVPVMIPLKKIEHLGMAGNVYENLKSLFKNDLDTSIDFITNDEIIFKIRYVDEKTNHMFVRIDEGETNIKRINNLNRINFDKYDIVIISDYNKGFLNEKDINLIGRKSKITFLDTKKKVNNKLVKNISFIKINEIEYNYVDKFYKYNNKTIITLSNRGAKFNNQIFPVEKVDVKDNTGAGDTFLSGLVYSYTKDSNLEKAIEFANKCATIVIQKRGTTIISLNDF